MHAWSSQTFKSSLPYSSLLCAIISSLFWLYLITAIPSSISHIPSPSLFSFLHSPYQFYHGFSTFHFEHNSSPCSILTKPPTPQYGFFCVVFSIYWSNLIYFQSITKETTLWTLFYRLTHDIFPFIPPSLSKIFPSIQSFIYPCLLIVSHEIFPRLNECRCFPLHPHIYGAYSTSAHTNFEVLGFIRSKPQEGRWRIRDKQAAWSRSCSLVCVSCHGRLLVSWSCHLPAGLLLWCYDFNVPGLLEWKKVLVRFISLEISHSIISSRNWNHVYISQTIKHLEKVKLSCFQPKVDLFSNFKDLAVSVIRVNAYIRSGHDATLGQL